MYAIMQMNTHKYGHGETRNKKLIKRRNDITQGWQLYRLGKRKGKKGEKNKLLLHAGGFEFGHPSEQDLTSLSVRNMFLVV